MDCESDESERWEDFFGSSTDLSPSVIAYYDRLSSRADESNDNSFNNGNSASDHSNKKSPRPPLPKLPPPTFRLKKHQRNFRCLSANVQRIISHSNTSFEMDHLKLNTDAPRPPERRLSPLKLPTTPPTSVGNVKFKHPLSKNMGILTQAGNDLIIDDSDGGYATPSEGNDSIDMGNNNNNNVFADNDKTPTNENAPIDLMTFEKDENSNNCDSMAMDNGKLLSAISENNNDEKLSNIEQCDDKRNSNVPSEESFKLTPTTLKNSWTYFHGMFTKPDNNSNSTTNRNSQFYVDDMTSNEIISNVVKNVDNNNAESKQQNENNGIDVTRLRPLSSVSISSTSSSSSSGSDEMSTNQNAFSYLASVESLADHSESENIRLRGNSTLTVAERACMEIIDTETTYVDDLGQVINGYLNDWRDNDCLENDQLELLFGNIVQVHAFSVILLGEFRTAGAEPYKISKCFLKLQDEFTVYTNYCTNYPAATSLLTMLLQSSTTNALLASTQKRLQHSLPLGSYLLKPVQRITRYHILLENLRKHSDVAEVSVAHDLMKSVARNIDQVKRNLEQQNRVKELSGILDGWLGPELTVLGDLKLEGTLMECNKPRTVLLFETMLIITKKKEDNRLQFKTYIHGKNLMLTEHIPGEPASFSVIPYNDPHPNQIKLTAKNREQKRQWAQHIKHVMLAHFDIPNRAKELLFQLGEEDSQSSDKSTWKWTNSSSSTKPEYLERRNQYRRSEMRYRSKKLRNGNHLSSENGHICDSVIEELRKRNGKNGSNEDYQIEEGTEVTEDLIETDDKMVERKNCSALERAKSKLMEVRIYNTKTIPKRIANLKKQRAKTLKETSKFYTDLADATAATTELKITESSPERNEKPLRRRASLDGSSGIGERKKSTTSLISMPAMSFTERLRNNKCDADIINDLLKNNQELNRLLNKTQKKSSSMNDMEKSGIIHETKTAREIIGSGGVLARPPELPIDEQTLQERISDFKRDLFLQEPIYESLLRNVHVPYKFPSPILNRSLSHPHYRIQKLKRPSEAPPNRPDSDYVTLSFNGNGQLEGVGGKILHRKESQLRKSDTNISYNGQRGCMNEDQPDNSNIIAGLQAAIDANMKSIYDDNVIDHHKSVDHLNVPKTLIKLPERVGSDVTGMQRKSIIHRQGSQALGSRIAISDYVDPKTLFTNSHQKHLRSSQTLINRISMQNKQLQRDSVVSSTSSSDSVNVSANTNNESFSSNSIPFDASKPLPPTPDVVDFDASDDSYYEKNIDSCLECDDVFRDSAIYSDESNERRYARPEHIYSTISEAHEIVKQVDNDDENENLTEKKNECQKEMKKPTPPPKLISHKIQPILLRAAPPPPLPAKPAFKIERPTLNASRSLTISTCSLNSFPGSLAPAVPPRGDRSSVHILPTIASEMQVPDKELPPTPKRSLSTSSWVLKQIKNFDK